MLFLGLDLAWGERNTSGGVAISWEKGKYANVLDVEERLGNDDAILAWVDRWDAAAGRNGLLMGIDAPLLVPNQTGKRPCESELGRRFARFQAGAHPANRTIFGGYVRGETLVDRLAERTIEHDPFLKEPKETGVRRVMEVFPHPAHIVLFDLMRTLKYKTKRGRTYESRWAVFAEYGRLLRAVSAQEPCLNLPENWPPRDVTGMIGSALKCLEDGLDALTCAYIVYWYWWHGASGSEIIGDMAGGYIVVPSKPKAGEVSI